MTKSLKIARIILFLLIAAWLIYAGCNALKNPYLPGMSPERVMEDTLQNLPDGSLQERQGEITDSVGDGKVIYQGWEKVRDSLQIKPEEMPVKGMNELNIISWEGPSHSLNGIISWDSAGEVKIYDDFKLIAETCMDTGWIIYDKKAVHEMGVSLREQKRRELFKKRDSL